MKLIPLFIAIMATSACTAPAPYLLIVNGTFIKSGLPVGGLPIRFVLSPSGAAQPCAPVLAEAVTDQQGKFSISTQYTPSVTERFAVLVQHHAVCAQLNGKWIPAWEFTTGPALPSISLRCSLHEEAEVTCEL